MDKWVVHPWQRAFISVHLVPLCSDVPGFKGASLVVPWVVVHHFCILPLDGVVLLHGMLCHC